MTHLLRCGLVGIGMMGRNHARVLRELSGAELVVIADRDGDPQKLGQSVPIVETVDQALEFGLDCAIVAVPTLFHEDVAIKCAKAGVATLIEKPLADSLEAAIRIRDAFLENGTLGVVGHIERFNPAIQELTKRLQAGELGEIFQIATRRQSSFPGRIADVGVTKDLATHDIDLVLAITGSGYKDISSFIAHRSGRQTEDMVLVSARLDDGTIVNHVVNWMSPMKERVTVVTGELGIFVADTLTGDLTLHKNGQFAMDWDSLTSFRGVSEGDVVRFAFSKTEPLKAELTDFLRLVNGEERSTSANLDDGIEVMRVIERIVELAR